MIGLRDFSASLGGRVVLREVSFAATAGEFVAVCGPNGAGKTTLLRALAGLLPGGARPDPTRVAYVEQGARCAWGLSIAEVAALGRIPHGDAGAAAVAAALERCGVAAIAGRRVDQVSGGQARRAMLARAFATEPRILLLDEPVADLDPAACHEILRVWIWPRRMRTACWWCMRGGSWRTIRRLRRCRMRPDVLGLSSARIGRCG